MHNKDEVLKKHISRKIKNIHKKHHIVKKHHKKHHYIRTLFTILITLLPIITIIYVLIKYHA